jgi:hypothetical protein
MRPMRWETCLAPNDYLVDCGRWEVVDARILVAVARMELKRRWPRLFTGRRDQEIERTVFDSLALRDAAVRFPSADWYRRFPLTRATNSKQWDPPKSSACALKSQPGLEATGSCHPCLPTGSNGEFGWRSVGRGNVGNPFVHIVCF